MSRGGARTGAGRPAFKARDRLIHINVALTPAQHQRAQQLAVDRSITVSEAVRILVDVGAQADLPTHTDK